MAIEVRIPKEIKEYKEKIIFGLNIRQLISVFIGAIVCLATYFLIKPITGTEIASDIVIVEAMPIFAFGFIRIRSLNFEQFAKIFIHYKFGKQKRVYETKSELEYLKNEKNLNSEEVKKGGFNKTRLENEKYSSIGRTKKVKEIRRRIKIAKNELKEETKRRKTKEVDESREQIKIARENYKRARKSKIK